MKKFLVQVVILLIVIFSAMAIYSHKFIDLPFLPQPATQAEAIIGSTKINIEIADTTSKRSQGLAGRSSLDANSGMLFMFDSPKMTAFWMKGMNFPLDIIWISENKIIDITKNVSAPASSSPDKDLTQYLPILPVDKVLEVNSGFVDKNNIKIGDTVQINQAGVVNVH